METLSDIIYSIQNTKNRYANELNRIIECIEYQDFEEAILSLKNLVRENEA